MRLSLTSNYSSPLSSPSTPPADFRPSFPDTSESNPKSLRVRRGITFTISLPESSLPSPSKGHLEPRFSNLPRRQLTPLRSAMLGGNTSSGLRTANVRDFKSPLRSGTLLCEVTNTTTTHIGSGRGPGADSAMATNVCQATVQK